MSNKTIALIDWNWAGHHPTYFTHFAVAMAEAGAEVVPFCADPEDFKGRLKYLALGDSAALIANPEKVEAPQSSRFRPARWRGIYQALRFFGGLGKQLRAWECQHDRKIDLVFFACIYDEPFEHLRFAGRLFGYSWAGLYLHARSFRMPGSPNPYTGRIPRPEVIFRSRLFRSVAVLDGAITGALREMTDGKPVHVFPDFTQENLPPGGTVDGLAGKIQRLSAGRPIVSLTGHLQWTKGIELFTRAACAQGMGHVFFFLGGDVNWAKIKVEDRLWMQDVWEKSENFYAHLQHLPESTMNSVVAISDVVYAAYKSFPHSSNVLTKAAVFERPLLVSDGYLMAERVREFGLGEVIPEGDADALAATLKLMVRPGYRDQLRGRARWLQYRTEHSAERLKNVFREVIKAL